jgi:PBP1b-binding outer membrane lipoprotein LpoB
MKSAIVAACAALVLAGCNSTGPTATAPAPKPNTINVAPSNFQMPAGSGCSGDIARYRAVQVDDLAMGQIAQPVYNQIHGEIEAAAQACSAGHDAEARAMILASRKRHGYPTAL